LNIKETILAYYLSYISKGRIKMDIKDTVNKATDAVGNLGVDKVKIEVDKDGKTYKLDVNPTEGGGKAEVKSN